MAVLVLLLAGQALTMRDLPLLGATLFVMAVFVLREQSKSSKMSSNQQVIGLIFMATAIMGALTSFGIWILR